MKGWIVAHKIVTVQPKKVLFIVLYDKQQPVIIFLLSRFKIFFYFFETYEACWYNIKAGKNPRSLVGKTYCIKFENRYEHETYKYTCNHFNSTGKNSSCSYRFSNSIPSAQKKHPRQARYLPEASKTAVALRLINNKDNVLPKRISMHPEISP